MKRILLALMFSAAVHAQETDKPEPIATDRPDQTETPFLVPRGMFQMETGFVYEKVDDNTHALVTPTVLMKYGLNENFELRLIASYTTVDFDGTKTSGFEPVNVGFKARLVEENGIIPKTSFIGHLQLPDVASKDFRADHYATNFRFVMQNTLSDKVSLGYNLGAEWDGMTPDATFIYTLTGAFNLTERLGYFAEVYGFAPESDKASHLFDTGFTWLINNDMMLDASAGVGLTDNASDFFVSVGYSFRI